MRRLFSTVYRILLIAAAILAVALSILAATSCDFLDFVHPYESSGRSMVHIERGRHLQSDTSVEDITAPVDATNDTTTPTTVGLVNTDYLAQLADSISQAGNLTDGAPDLAAAQAAAQEQAAGILAAAINGTGDESNTTTDTDGSVRDQSVQDVSKNSTDELGAVGDEDVVHDFDDIRDASNATQSTDDAVSEESIVGAEDGSIAPSGRDPSIVSEAESGGIATTFNKTDADASLTDDFLDKIPANAYGVNASDIPSVAISGSAGLFCSANDVSIFDIWKGTFLDSEIAIDEESAHDESEDIARNGAVVSITFGILVTFILVIETLIGWKMCCEKWIVGLLALCACVSQGVTFLFFNSERYCDANIIHEILEQDPCVPGQGGMFSVVALILYAFIILLVCCAPSADPYHLLCCCRAQKESSPSDPHFSSLELAENKSSDGALMSSGEGSNFALSGRDSDVAPWMSKEEKEKKENEII